MGSLTAVLRTIILLGAIQGFIVSALLFFSPRPPRVNRLLGIVIFLIALASLRVYLEDIPGGFYSLPGGRWLDAFFPFIVIMPVGPLLYFYVRGFRDPDFKFTPKMRVHFYPMIIDLVPQLTALVYVAGVLAQWWRVHNGLIGRFIDNYNVYSDIPRWISLTTYLVLAMRGIGKVPAVAGGRGTGWLRQLIRGLLIFQGIWLLYLIPYVIPRYTDILLNTVDWYPVYVPLAVIIYWMGIKGLLMSYRAGLSESGAGLSESGAGLSASGAGKREARVLAIPEATVQATVLSLLKTMESDQLYLNPELSLSLVAEHTGIAPKTISAVLNQYLQKSFSEFVNEYRVKAVRERLLKRESKNLTIAGLAYECGFNSQPTFQRAFKAAIGVSPREFLMQQTIKSGFE
jgi:AraC-like DNA-binding protein